MTHYLSFYQSIFGTIMEALTTRRVSFWYHLPLCACYSAHFDLNNSGLDPAVLFLQWFIEYVFHMVECDHFDSVKSFQYPVFTIKTDQKLSLTSSSINKLFLQLFNHFRNFRTYLLIFAFNSMTFYNNITIGMGVSTLDELRNSSFCNKVRNFWCFL